MNPEIRQCQNCKKDFGIEPEDFDFYEKIKVPPPTWCPMCRLMRRLAWRNERSLHRRECDKCHKQIISVFAKETGLTVYCQPCWWSDNWDGLSYGVKFDPSRPFLLQLKELLQRVPVMSLFGLYKTFENSDYVNMATALKNCYLLTHSDYSENCAYGSINDHCKDSLDNSILAYSELCYESVNCQKCYQTFFSSDCESCNNTWFSLNCVGCSDCFGCVNLRNKKYCMFNTQYSKEEYEKELQKMRLDAFEGIRSSKAKAQDFWKSFPQKFIHARHTSNVSGDYIYNAKNTRNTFIGIDMEDSRFCALITPPKVTNCYDFTHYGHVSDLVYDSLQVGNEASRISWSWFAVAGVQNVEYSMFAIGCKNIFGNVGLKKREYCILNTQYSKDEYESLRKQIIQQMEKIPYKDAQGIEYRYGEFFPVELSPFGYNETTAQEQFPLEREAVKKKGYTWRDPQEKDYAITKNSSELPNSVSEIQEGLLKETIGCAHEGKCSHRCSRAFKLIPLEIQFHKRLNLPLPRLCPACRHGERLERINPMRLWKRKCLCAGVQSKNSSYKNISSHFHGAGECPNEFETSYSPDKPEIIYCEQCYNAEVV